MAAAGTQPHLPQPAGWLPCNRIHAELAQKWTSDLRRMQAPNSQNGSGGTPRMSLKDPPWHPEADPAGGEGRGRCRALGHSTHCRPSPQGVSLLPPPPPYSRYRPQAPSILWGWGPGLWLGLMDFETTTERLWVLCSLIPAAGVSRPAPPVAPCLRFAASRSCFTKDVDSTPACLQVRHLPGSRCGQVPRGQHPITSLLSDGCMQHVGAPIPGAGCVSSAGGSIQSQGCCRPPTLPPHPLGRWAAASGEPETCRQWWGVAGRSGFRWGVLRDLQGARVLGGRAGHSHAGFPRAGTPSLTLPLPCAHC